MKSATQEIDELLGIERAHLDFRNLILRDEEYWFNELFISLDAHRYVDGDETFLFFDSFEKELFVKYAVVANWYYGQFSEEKKLALRELGIDDEYIEMLGITFDWFRIARQLFDGV